MRSKKAVLFFYLSFFLIFAFFTSSAQVRRNGGAKHKSFYLSAGYNKSQFSNSTIHIQQDALNNKYDLLKVKGDNTKSYKSIFPWQLNYRIGYYYNYEQTCGLELGYDPVNYHMVNGQTVKLKGTLNNVPNVSSSFPFSAANGYYYALNGANFLLFNFVRRFTVYRPNSNRVGVDAIGKLGAGPVMPNFVSNIAKDSFNAKQFRLCGWNAAAEAALRVTIYRYGYLEIAAKYDYALYNNLTIDKGTAKQNLRTLEIVGCVGFTLPTNRFNPLFHHERRIVTIIPFFMDKKLADSLETKDIEERKARYKGEGNDTVNEVPEFSNVVDKKTKWEDQLNKIRQDSLALLAAQDSAARQQSMDSLAAIRKAYNDSLEAIVGPRDTASIGATDTTGKTGEPGHKETRKERKARLKKEKQDLKEKANGAEAPPANGVVPPPGEPQAPGAETAEAPKELSKKELKAKKKEEARKLREKQRMEQEAAEKAEKEKIEKLMNESKEQEEKDQAKAEQEKKDKKDKKEQEKREKEEKKAQEKKDREAAKEKERQEKEEQKEKERKEKEEQKEKERKEKEDKKESEGK